MQQSRIRSDRIITNEMESAAPDERKMVGFGDLSTDALSEILSFLVQDAEALIR